MRIGIKCKPINLTIKQTIRSPLIPIQNLPIKHLKLTKTKTRHHQQIQNKIVIRF